MTIALLLAAVPVNAPVAVPSVHFSAATDVGTPAPIAATRQTAGSKLPCADRVVRYGLEFVAASALTGLALLAESECLNATGMDNATAYMLVGSSYFIVAPTVAATAAWGMSRLPGENKPWGHALLGAEAGAVLAVTLSAVATLVLNDSFTHGTTMSVAIPCVLLSFPAIGAVVGLNL